MSLERVVSVDTGANMTVKVGGGVEVGVSRRIQVAFLNKFQELSESNDTPILY